MCAALFHAVPLAAREQFQCSIESAAAASVLDLRDRGQPKDFLLAPLPARETLFKAARGTLQARLAVQMYSIVEDVYSHPNIQAAPYVAYRAASCARRNAGRKVPLSFAEVALPMSGCQEKHGNRSSPALNQCVEEVLEYFQRQRGASPP